MINFDGLNFENYHKHSYDSNIYMTDSATSIEDYAKRAIELGQKTLSTVEHGYCGRFLVDYEVAEKYKLKLVIGAEAYWVNDRNEKDKTNNHIVILAKNENGRQWLNEALSQANETGLFNGRARLDWELIDLLPPDDVFVTSACIGFNGYGQSESKKAIMKLHNKFKDNFMIEIQYHHSDAQKEYNQFLMDIARENNIDIIMGCDSHMVDESQKEDRDDLLASRKIFYEDETSWFMDYPSVDVVIERLKVQGILSDEEIYRAINNTNIMLTFEDFHFDTDEKMPNILGNMTEVERKNLYKKLVLDGWNEFKNHLDEKRFPQYYEEIAKEVKTVCDINKQDYFIINHKLINLGIENGGVLTPTGRGSASSFLTNTLLGFSTMDRLSSDVKLYPERFISKERQSMPDIDFNCATPSIFEDAQVEVMGADHAYPMIAFGKLKPKSAFKMYARSQNLDMETAQAISDQIGKFERDYNKAEEEDKEDIILLDYIDEEYHPYIESSEKYLGIIADKKRAPCSFILHSGSIRREIGLIRIVSKSTGKDVICANIEGAVADRFGYVKNDLLKVDVHLLTKRVCDRVGTKFPTSLEMIELTRNNDATWEIYEKGLVTLVNQVDSDGTRAKAMAYKPKNYSELSAFVAAIRPSFKSMWKRFVSREPFEYGIPSLDTLLQTEHFQYSYMLYQEQIMAVLNYAGIPMGECYSIIKAISKKKHKVIQNAKDDFAEGMAIKLRENDSSITQERVNTIIEQIWAIINDAARYCFNASHSLAYAIDSLYCAYLKANYPFEFYEVALQMYSDKGKKDKVTALIKEMKQFGIELGDFCFRKDNRKFNIIREENKIYPSILSIKFMNDEVAYELYNIKDQSFETFTELLIYLLEHTILTKRHIEILIKINYFKEFGGNKKLDIIYDNFQKRYKKTHIDKTKEKRRDELIEFEKELPDNKYTLKEQYQFEIEKLDYPITVISQAPSNLYVISDYDDKYGIKFTCFNISDGSECKYTIYKDDWKKNPFGKGSIIQFDSHIEKKDGSLRLKTYKYI